MNQTDHLYGGSYRHLLIEKVLDGIYVEEIKPDFGVMIGPIMW